jgi:hypothetical protein
MPLCRKCGLPFNREYSAWNQKDCIRCSAWIGSNNAKNRTLGALMKQLKEEADASGNPKVWTAQEYSQEFLRGLIPGRG